MVFNYNCEKYSIKDILSFVTEKGYQIKMVNELNEGKSLKYIIKSRGIEIRVPDLNLFDNKKMWNKFGAPGIFLEKANQLSRKIVDAQLARDIAQEKIAWEEYNTWFKKSKKLYNELKKKFQLKKGEWPQSIKDEEYIKSLLKQHEKKWWQR